MNADPRINVYRKLLREASEELSGELVEKILASLKLKPPKPPSRNWLKKNRVQGGGHLRLVGKSQPQTRPRDVTWR